MKLKFILIIVIVFSSITTNGQCKKLTPLTSITENPNYGVNGELFIPEFNLTEDKSGNLYHNEKLILKRTDALKYCIYELFNDRYIVVSILNRNEFVSNYSYLLPKKNIIVIDLLKPDLQFQIDLENKFLNDIYYDEDGKLLLQAINKVHIYKLDKPR